MKKILLFFTIAISYCNSIQAQCDNEDYECWLQEIVMQIENGNFKTSGKPFRRATKKKAPSNVRVAAQTLKKTRIKNYYEPLAGLKSSATQKQNEKYYKESLKLLNQGKGLAERNLGMTNSFTSKLDSMFINFFVDKITLVEEQRATALETAYESGTKLFDNRKFGAALAQLEFFYREADDSDPKRTEVSEKIRDSKYEIAFKVAEYANESGKYDVAFVKIQEAIKHKSDGNALNLREDIANAGYEEVINKGKGLSDGGKFDETIKLYKDSEKFWKYTGSSTKSEYSSPSELISLTELEAAQSYLGNAVTDYQGGNDENALKNIDKSKKYSGKAEIPYGNSTGLDADGLLNLFHNEKKEEGENLYNEKKFNEAKKKFKAAGVYKDKEKMESKAKYIEAVGKAEMKQNAVASLRRIEDLSELSSLWNEAINLKSNASIFNNESINVYDRQANAKRAVELAVQARNLLNYSEKTKSNRDKATEKLNEIPFECAFKDEYLNTTGKTRASEEVTVTITYKGIRTNIHNDGDCKRFYGSINVNLQNKSNGDLIPPTRDSTVINWQNGNGNSDYTPRNVANTPHTVNAPNNANKSFSFSVDKEAYDKGEIQFVLTGYLKQCHKDGGFPGINYGCSGNSDLSNAAQKPITNRTADDFKISFTTDRQHTVSLYFSHSVSNASSSRAIISSSPAINNSVYPRSNSKYFIQSAIGGKYLEVKDKNPNRRTPLQLWGFKGSIEQKFRLVDAGGGYFYIQSEFGRAIHVEGGNKNPKADVNLWDIVNQDNLKWKFIDAGNGYYYIQSKLGTNLDVQWGKNVNGTPIWTYGANQGIAQKWKLKKVN